MFLIHSLIASYFQSDGHQAERREKWEWEKEEEEFSLDTLWNDDYAPMIHVVLIIFLLFFMKNLFFRWWSISFYAFFFISFVFVRILGSCVFHFLYQYCRIFCHHSFTWFLPSTKGLKTVQKSMSERKFMEGTHNHVNSVTHIMWGPLLLEFILVCSLKSTEFLNKFWDLIIIFVVRSKISWSARESAAFKWKKNKKKNMKMQQNYMRKFTL